MRPALLWILTLVATAPAFAQGVGFVGKLSNEPSSNLQRQAIGDARYVALSPLDYGGARGPQVEILDLAKQRVMQVVTDRDALVKAFGVLDPQLGWAIPPQGEVVRYTANRVGLFLHENDLGSSRRNWYAEVDSKTGAIVRDVKLGTLAAGEQLLFAGTDAGRATAWWALQREREIVLRKLDLATYAVHDVMKVARVPRASSTGYEDHLFVHAASDFSRFAVVEYFEDGMQMAPGRVYILDPIHRSSFELPAPSTAYGVAFTRDGRHLYLGSSQHGTISRVDLAAKRVDRTVQGPTLMQHLVVSPKGTHLFALNSSSSYSVFELPDLEHPIRRAHVAENAPAAKELHGGGFTSIDGRWLLLEGATQTSVLGGSQPRGMVIARLID